MSGPLRVPLGPGGVRERRRALSAPLRPQPSSGNLCPLRKGRKNRSARRGEEPQAEARPRRGQRPPPRVRPRPLGPRRARGALGAAATHAPPATKRRGARARRPRGRGAGGGGPCGGLSRERAARRLGAEGPPGAEGHRGTLGTCHREQYGSGRRVPLQAENPGGGGTSLRRSCCHRGLAAGEEEHGSADSCCWRRDTELRRRDLGRVPGPGPRSGLEWVTRRRGTFLPWRRRTCGLCIWLRRDLCVAPGLSWRCPSSVLSCCP